MTMHRRDFITLLGSAAAWPIAARAQQSALPVIGFLNSTSPEANTIRMRAFRAGLKEVGYVEGESVTIEHRWADGHFDRLAELAAELVRRKVTVIAAPGNTPSALAAKAASSTIPIVFAVGEDPVRLGLVSSLARPGGNLTGINFLNVELVAKRFELLRDLIPGAVRVGVLVNPADARNTETTLREVEAAARAMGMQTQVMRASTSGEVETAIAAIACERCDALFVAGDAFLNSRRLQLALLAARHGMPASYGSRDYPEYGGLMSYGANLTDAFRLAGVYTARILKGAKPTDLPVEQASKFELVINHPAAKILGLTIPPTLFAPADEVIE